MNSKLFELCFGLSAAIIFASSVFCLVVFVIIPFAKRREEREAKKMRDRRQLALPSLLLLGGLFAVIYLEQKSKLESKQE